jgi:hypothetical protein
MQYKIGHWVVTLRAAFSKGEGAVPVTQNHSEKVLHRSWRIQEAANSKHVKGKTDAGDHLP